LKFKFVSIGASHMTGRAKTSSSEIRKHENAANPRYRAINPKNALATMGRSQGHAKRSKIYGNAQKSALKSTAIVCMEPNLRITPPMQAEIIRLYMEGCSLCEIARQTGRARQTVTKVARRLDVEAKIREQKEKLLAESDAWLESINFAVTHETDGRLAYRLSEAFGIIPSLSKKTAPVKPQDDWKGVDPQTMARAKMLGQIAMERGSSMRLENDELEKNVQEDSPVRK
jgi:transposase-like protein